MSLFLVFSVVGFLLQKYENLGDRGKPEAGQNGAQESTISKDLSSILSRDSRQVARGLNAES